VLKGSEVITIDQNRCGFAYRDSIFKSSNDNVILAAAFKFTPANRHECEARIAEIIAKRKATQPQGTASAGCMFKNFEFTYENEIAKLASMHALPKDFLARKMIPAGWLIEQAGLKGYAIGGASVSEVHGNFLVVTPGAKADHIHQLVASIKSKIRNSYGIQLQEEVQFFV
jgi:UDP-N-acetylmuramate dehydrogenase